MHILRSALGQAAKLGTLYDARTDAFLPICVLNPDASESVITRTEKISTEFDFSTDGSLKERFKKLGLNTDLQASYLGGFVKARGSGNYLNACHNTSGVVEATLYHRFVVREKTLEVRSKEVADFLALDNLGGGFATHVVIGITFGAYTIVNAKHRLEMSDSRDKVSAALKERLDWLKAKLSGKETNTEEDHNSESSPYEFDVHVHSDIPIESGMVPNTFDGAYSFLDKVSQHFSKGDGGIAKAKPVAYTLLPLQLLAFLQGKNIAAANTPLVQIHGETLVAFIDLFADLSATQLTLSDYHTRILGHQECVPQQHMTEIKELAKTLSGREAALRSRFAITLKNARAGSEGPESLWELLKEYQGKALSLDSMSGALGKFTDKMDFFDMVTRDGAEYFGFASGLTFDKQDLDQFHELYVFRFNWELQYGSHALDENIAIFFELLEQAETARKAYVVKDCDGTGESVERPCISHRCNGVIITENLAEGWRERADKSFMQYDLVNFEHGRHKRPIKTAKVILACPGKNCNQGLHRDWICYKCNASIIFGYSDTFLYCECGRGLCENWTFQCADPIHGPEWTKYDGTALLNVLNKLEPLEPLNILILGETGVGKSTFINAFINYLTYDSLEDAMKAKKLECIIPFSFATQVVDKTDPRRPFITTTVSAGVSNNEKDGSKGQSATQNTLVHTVHIGNRNVRLFDTPSIGDTRGPMQDTANMADILSVLANYETLHGILILLKPNNAQLTVMFRFCIKELLAHLHRDAARNMVFGFTNTRGSNYKPGDTFEPLKQELACNKEVDIGLFEETVYCFDSESFRYLAAHHQGVDLGDRADYSRSWEKSMQESNRLLKYFEGLTPHQVTSTVNLNETRHLITELTKPMAEIMQAINDTIKVNQDQIRSLTEDELKIQDLEKQLYVQIRTLQAHLLDRPRTVCSHVNCVDHQDDGTDTTKQNLRVVYRTHCHNPCYLGDFPADQITHPQLIHCAAFKGNGGFCKVCTHSWQVHLYVLYELKPELKVIVSKDAERKLKEATSDIEIKKIAIAEKQRVLADIKAEYEAIESAAVRCSLFLKKNSITPYNDATLDYLGFMIKEERGKVAVGRDPAKLDDLEKYRDQYREHVKILSDRMESGMNCELLTAQEVHQKVRELYSLPYYGAQLRQIQSVVRKTHGDTFREESHNLRVRPKPFKRPSAIRKVLVHSYQYTRDGISSLALDS